MTVTAEHSLWDPLSRRSARPDLLLTWDDDHYSRWSWEEWRDAALRFGGGLRRLGVHRGDRVASLLTNSSGSCAGVLGAWFAGACLLSLPLISRGMAPEAYIAQLRRIVAQSQPVLLLCPGEFKPLLEQAGLDVRIAALEEVDAAPVDPALAEPNEPAFVQYTSGSTTEPRGCVLTPGAIARQLTALERALQIDPERDTGVVWLPLSHDMGLFGCLLLTYWTGHRLVLSSPQRFLKRPGSWFEDCARFQATVSAAPSFALELATRVANAHMPPPFPMRRLVVGGERVEPDTLLRAAQVLGEERIRLSALVPAYGLAEAVLAVTMAPLDQEPTVVHVDGSALARGEVRQLVNGQSDRGATTVGLTSVGRPLPGNHVRADTATQVGEIVIRSSSLAEGYLDAPEATAERFTAAGLRTGDLGFVESGNLYVTGRLDDLICIAGRNLYARDLEAALAEVDGVRPGAYSIVGANRRGATSLVALVEPRAGHPDLTIMAGEISARVRAEAGATIDECIFVPHGRLPKTPSGKVQRFRCQEIAASEADPGVVRIRS